MTELRGVTQRQSNLIDVGVRLEGFQHLIVEYEIGDFGFRAQGARFLRADKGRNFEFRHIRHRDTVAVEQELPCRRVLDVGEADASRAGGRITVLVPGSPAAP